MSAARGDGIFTIACSWALVHTVFALRYAHIYYTPPEGGIDFKVRDVEPDYRDFAYTAFTVGHDVPGVRHRHHVSGPCATRCWATLLSFLFGAVILATTVNVVAGLLNT